MLGLSSLIFNQIVNIKWHLLLCFSREGREIGGPNTPYQRPEKMLATSHCKNIFKRSS
jgi:hypothetical protein